MLKRFALLSIMIASLTACQQTIQNVPLIEAQSINNNNDALKNSPYNTYFSNMLFPEKNTGFYFINFQIDGPAEQNGVVGSGFPELFVEYSNDQKLGLRKVFAGKDKKMYLEINKESNTFYPLGTYKIKDINTKDTDISFSSEVKFYINFNLKKTNQKFNGENVDKAVVVISNNIKPVTLDREKYLLK